MHFLQSNQSDLDKITFEQGKSEETNPLNSLIEKKKRLQMEKEKKEEGKEGKMEGEMERKEGKKSGREQGSEDH